MKIFILLLLILIAQSCPNNCTNCDPDASVCYACAFSFELNIFGTCVDSTTVSKCSLYGPSNICFACQPTYTITNGQCIKDYSACIDYDPSNNTACTTCAFGTVLQNSKCVGTINCANNTVICTSCIQGFQLKGNQCVDNTGNCNQVGGNGVCVNCKSGFSLVGYSCISNNITDYGCYIYSTSNNCLACKSGYNVYEGYCLLPTQLQQIIQGITQLSSILSQRASVLLTTTTTVTTTTTSTSDNSSGSSFSFDSGNTNFGFSSTSFGPSPISNCNQPDPNNLGVCLVCNSGFYPGAIGCLQASVFCDTSDPQSGNCLSCKFSFILKNGACNDPNCQNQTVAGCVICKSYFSVNSNNYCQYSDTNCFQATATQCMICAAGYFVTSSGFCQILPANCQIPNVNTYLCVQCNSGYTQSNGVCNLIPVITISFCKVQSGSQCTQCNAGYQLNNNQCLVVQLPANCQLADPNNLRNCLTCISGYTLNNGACLQSQLPSTPFCQSYNSFTGQCIACITGYSINSGMCSATPNNPSSTPPSNPPSTPPSAPSSSGTSGSGGSIAVPSLIRDPNCAKYINNACAACSNRFYFGTNSLCIPINPLCSTFSSNGNCLTCYPGYTLSGASCIISRIQDPNCKNYTTTGICSNCYTGFYYSSQKVLCQPLNPLCKTSNLNDGTCTSCFPGYSLINGLCIVAFRDPNCAKFDPTNSVCLQCSLKFFLGSTGTCVQVNPLCKTSDQNSGACLSCFPGYTISGQKCVTSGITNSDINCQTIANGICTTCYSGYYMNLNGFCSQFNPLCKTSNITTGLCLSCYPGYYLASGSCLQGGNPNADPNCMTANPTCTACYSGYYLTAGLACQKMDPLCKNYTSSHSSCTLCYDGYFLSNGQCIITVVATQSSDPYCVSFTNSGCVVCASGYYLSPTGCLQLNPYCQSSNMTTGLCTSCYTGYSLIAGNCIVAAVVNIPYCSNVVGNQCTSCINGFFVENGACSLVNILCGTYDANSGNCLSCIRGYVFQSGVCILPSLGIDPNCKHYTNSYCSQCQSGYALTNYWCIDPNCLQFVSQTNTCLSCNQGKIAQGSSCV